MSLSKLDPGMAFGTEHPTTKDDLLPRTGASWWQTVIDVGTGSGVSRLLALFLELRKSMPMTLTILAVEWHRKTQ